MLGEDDRVGRARRFEPRGGEAMTERATVIGERRVDGIARKVVPEDPRTFTEIAIAVHELDAIEIGEMRRERARRRPDERGEARLGEAVSEHARRAKAATRFGVEIVEASLEDRDHRARRVVAPSARRRADELLE